MRFLIRSLLLAPLLTAMVLPALQGCGRTSIAARDEGKKPVQEEPEQPGDDPDPDPEKPGQDPKEDPPPGPVPTAQPQPTPKPRPSWAPLPKQTPYPYSPYTPPPIPTPSPPPVGVVTPPPPSWQPNTPDEFYALIQKFGYSGSRDAAFARVGRYVGIETKAEWSARARRELPKKFESAKRYLDPAPGSIADYDARAKAFAKAPGSYYVRTDISFRSGADLTVIKGNPATREVLAYNLKGELTSFTRLKAMYHRHVILVPPGVYR